MTQNPAPDDRPWGRDARSELAERIRRRDVRIPHVERAFLARQLGLTDDDLCFLGDEVVDRLLNLPVSVVGTIGAERLLERLDAAVARDHPVDLERPDDRTWTARVPVDKDATIELTLTGGLILLDQDVLTADHTEVTNHLDLEPNDAEALAYALLRLVDHARTERPETTEYTDQVIGTDNGPQENR